MQAIPGTGQAEPCARFDVGGERLDLNALVRDDTVLATASMRQPEGLAAPAEAACFGRP